MATLIYELKPTSFSSTFLKQKRAKQLRAHGKPWMQRVPYTFPLHNYPPNSVFFKRFFAVLLAFLIYLDKIKVDGDSFLTTTFQIKVSSPYYMYFSALEK